MSDDESNRIIKQFMKWQLVSAPAMMAIGLSLYGLLGGGLGDLHPLLGDETFLTNILIAGVIVEAWASYAMWPLLVKMSKRSGTSAE